MYYLYWNMFKIWEKCRHKASQLFRSLSHVYQKKKKPYSEIIKCAQPEGMFSYFFPPLTFQERSTQLGKCICSSGANNKSEELHKSLAGGAALVADNAGCLTFENPQAML